MKRTIHLAIALCLSMTLPVVAELGQVKTDVKTLADDSMGGRMTGSEGEKLAADYITEELKNLGMIPLPKFGSFLQPFEFTAGMDDGGSILTLMRGDSKLDFAAPKIQALSFSDNAEVTGEVVFAGYGLSIPEEKGFGYDSYFGLDVKDKIVVVLRYVPEGVDDEARAVLARYSGLRYKALHARELGAKAMVVVTGPLSPGAGETIPMSFDSALGGSGIVAASIDGAIADALFADLPEGGLKKVQQDLDTGNPHITGFSLDGVTLTLKTNVLREKKTGNNVVGVLPPTSAAPISDFIVIGAHFDHLGRGDRGGSLADKDSAGEIHNGADDNASGVAATLAVARELLDKQRSQPIAFAFWSGEELGLLGSGKFIESEPFGSARTEAYLNFDMVGRMRDEKLTVQSVGSSPEWRRLLEQTNVVAGLDLMLQDDPYLPTDSTSFYQASIPALHFFTGSHEHYHKPSDDVETINFEGIEASAQFVAKLTLKLMNNDAPIAYAKVERSKESGTDRDTVRAYTGTIPDYSEEVEGLLLAGVIGGGPADAAGLQKGDVIVRFGSREIKNIYDYTFALDVAKIDEPLEIEFVRDGEKKKTVLTPTQRK